MSEEVKTKKIYPAQWVVAAILLWVGAVATAEPAVITLALIASGIALRQCTLKARYPEKYGDVPPQTSSEPKGLGE